MCVMQHDRNARVNLILTQKIMRPLLAWAERMIDWSSVVVEGCGVVKTVVELRLSERKRHY